MTAVDGITPTPVVNGFGIPVIIGPRVLKVIKKVEVQVLCTQHNPVRVISLRMSIFELMNSATGCCCG